MYTVTIFVKYRETYLLLKRSDKVSSHKGLWSTLSLLSDTEQIPREEIIDLVTSSIGIEPDEVKSIVQAIKLPEDPQDEFFFVVKINKPFIEPSWEYESYEWIESRGIGKYETTPFLKEKLDKVKNLY